MAAQCKVGQNVLKNYAFLKTLAKTTSEKKRRNIIENASPCEIASLSECCFNVKKGNFQLTPARVVKLKRHAPVIRKMADVRDYNKAKKIIQVGKGFPFAALLVPILLEATKHILER